MAVKDIRRSQGLGGLQHGPAKQGKALGVIVIVAERGAVELIAIEERRVVDEIELHSGAEAAVEHRAETVTVIEGHGDAGDYLARVVELGLPVARQKTVTLWPREASAAGRAPMTSASPPVLEKGTHSDAAKAMCMKPPGAAGDEPTEDAGLRKESENLSHKASCYWAGPAPRRIPVDKEAGL